MHTFTASLHRRVQAFGRTELLVVIGILVLLAALGTAWAFHVQKQSSTYQCAQNLKAIGASMAMYITDNDTKLPYAFIHANDQQQMAWDSLIGSYLKSGKQGADRTKPAQLGEPTLCPSDSIAPLPWAIKYGVKRRTYAMPWHTMDKGNWPPAADNSTGVGLWWGKTGGPNSLAKNLSTNTNALPAIRREIILLPVDTLLVTEQALSNNISHNSSGAKIRYTADHLDTAIIPANQFHRGKFNYLMVDGHVQTLYPESTVGRTGAVGDDPKKHHGMWTIRADD